MKIKKVIINRVNQQKYNFFINRPVVYTVTLRMLTCRLLWCVLHHAWTPQYLCHLPFLTNLTALLSLPMLTSSCPTTFLYLPQSHVVPGGITASVQFKSTQSSMGRKIYNTYCVTTNPMCKLFAAIRTEVQVSLPAGSEFC